MDKVLQTSGSQLTPSFRCKAQFPLSMSTDGLTVTFIDISVLEQRHLRSFSEHDPVGTVAYTVYKYLMQ
jgi:hypothetical protein